MQDSGNTKCRVYCAGPLFNAVEREEMTRIADELCRAGFSVYLPHRDGMEFRLILDVLAERGWSPELAGSFLHAAIFALDVYQLVVECQCTVWNLNGRTPDEGAVAEAAVAWTLGQPLVAFTDDARSLIAGRINPLLVGLVEFQTVDAIDQIVPALEAEIGRTGFPLVEPDQLPKKLQTAVRDGRELWAALQEDSQAAHKPHHTISPDQQTRSRTDSHPGTPPPPATDALSDNERIADVVERLFAPRGADLSNVSSTSS